MLRQKIEDLTAEQMLMHCSLPCVPVSGEQDERGGQEVVVASVEGVACEPEEWEDLPELVRLQEEDAEVREVVQTR